MTGNFEKPVALESSMTSLTGSVASTQAICTRGVMISPAVRGPKATERCTRWAVSESSVPSLAERPASEASSSEDRAERSSSCGSTPNARTMRVGRAVEQLDRVGHHGGEAADEALGTARDREGDRDAELLGHQLAEDHRGDGGQHQSERDGDAGHRALGDPDRRQRGLEQATRWRARPGSR